MIGIPREIGHIWIGPNRPPTEWMNTWKENHEDWNYQVYGNHYLESRKFRTGAQINEYLRRGQYAGAADLIRYEVLFDKGGFIPPCDAICLRNTDELFQRSVAYTVYENEFTRGKLVSPILACEPGNEFVLSLIKELEKVSPEDLDEPWISTGNLFVARMIRKVQPDIQIFPSHTFIPTHFTGEVYEGSEKVYCKQMFGSTRNAYPKSKGLEQISRSILEVRRKAYKFLARKKAAKRRNRQFEQSSLKKSPDA